MNQIDHLCVNRKWIKSLQDVLNYRGADINTTHYLVKEKFKLKLFIQIRTYRLRTYRLRTYRLRNLTYRSLYLLKRCWNFVHKSTCFVCNPMLSHLRWNGQTSKMLIPPQLWKCLGHNLVREKIIYHHKKQEISWRKGGVLLNNSRLLL